MKNETPAPECITGPRKLSLYQEQARHAFAVAADEDRLMPWAWILTTCSTDRCLNPEHMIVHSPTKIAYPAGVCVYCGLPAGTRDHLLPHGKTGSARRIFVAIVPACADCNARISDFPDHNIDARRTKAHASIRRTKKRILESPEHDLSEYGPNLRSYIVAKQHEKQVTLMRLDWPEDPNYDVRAFQLSGIEDPVGLGLCLDPGTGWAAS